MPRLHCPFCGPRALSEFRFRKSLPDAQATGAFERTYLRSENPRETREDWQHLEGCRAWLSVHRDPSSSEVFEVRLAQAGEA